MPLSFLVDAMEAKDEDDFHIVDIGQPFGIQKEAYLRPCYEDLVLLMDEMRQENR